MLIILCPKSRASKGKKRWQRWFDQLDSKRINYKTEITQHPGHATELAREARNLAVAVGGDGTINEVINGIKMANPQPRLGILYAGTSPDFCRFHQLSLNHDEMIDPLTTGRSKKIDLIKMQFRDKKKNVESRYFACSANIGLGSDITDFSNKLRPYVGDFLGTLMGAIKAFFINRPFPAEITLDGKHYKFDNCNHIMLIKNPYIASGIKFGLDIAPSDGKAYVLAIKDKSRLGLLKLLPKLYRGKKEDLQGPDFWLKPFNKITINSLENVKVEFDGDSQGFLPITATMCQDSIDLTY